MITDVTEMSRLTAAPNMQQVWVSGNPFTKTHSATAYRVAIFNFFRETPGFTEDMVIDGSPPGLVERRQLIDRVFEKPPPPPISQRLQAPPPLSHSRAVERDASSSPMRGPQETQNVTRNTLKKKSNRQHRIVSLDGSVSKDQGNRAKVDPSASGVQVDSGGSEDYRRRLEALRDEAGAGWLRVLSESGGLTTENGHGIQENVAKT
jgi:hypothetical protein